MNDATAPDLNPCIKCKQRGPYWVFMTQDSWVAECRRCGALIDIGQPPARGYGLVMAARP